MRYFIVKFGFHGSFNNLWTGHGISTFICESICLFLQ